MKKPKIKIDKGKLLTLAGGAVWLVSLWLDGAQSDNERETLKAEVKKELLDELSKE